MEVELSGNVALITGAGRGIGSAIAERLAADGAVVALVDRNVRDLEKTAHAIRVKGGQVKTFEADVTDPIRASEIVEETVKTFGHLDILVNNAGNNSARPFLSIDIDQWRHEIELNLSAAFYYCQPAARAMKERGYGRIILMTSVTAMQGPIDLAAYGAAKSGQFGLMRAMALELGEFGITTNAVAPGPTNTELMRQTLTAEMQEIVALRVPAKRAGEVEDVAQAVAFLSSPKTAFVNGVVIPVDGGLVAAGGFMVELFRRRREGYKPSE
jgi:NAD(P)-dependent dehydrogenase (short-subunit alcohol dehydrogenase family)